MDTEKVKRLVGIQVVDALVHSGMKLGLGTGSTAAHAVNRVGELLKAGSLGDIVVVPTSFQTVVACQRAGISLAALNDPAVDGRLDLTIDGADEVDPHWNLIKGGGAAMLIEKVVAQASERYCIMVHSSKLSSRLGEKAPVPVEIVPEALVTTTRRLESLGGKVELRMATKKAGPIISDHGNFILDVTFAEQFDSERLDAEIMMIPGVTANGIFTRRVDDLFIGHPDGRVEHKHR
ncbi:MAG: ribose 5-phosphate isomerase A [Spirochaetaceae bacterium]|nr:MAG: ribose 5-phosphate isomerase A [Spirochaetaceae bacterium]